MLSEAELWDILRRTTALREGHYRLTSGLHTDRFLICAQTLQYPEYTERICRALAERVGPVKVNAIVGAAVGGILVAYEMARAMGARAMFAEKVPGGGMKLRREFRLEPGERVLVVEDVVSTGGSVRKVMEAIAPFSPQIVGVAAIVDRSGGRVDFGVPFWVLARTEMAHWTPEECPLCRAGEPLKEPKG